MRLILIFLLLFIPFVNSPLETRMSEYSLHSLRSGAGKGKWRQTGQVNRGTVSPELRACFKFSKSDNMCHVERGNSVSRCWFVSENSSKTLEAGGHQKEKALEI